MSDSSQKRVGRVRPPRVQITYDVEDGGASTSRELPLVAGVIGDLSGDADDPVEYAQRQFVEVEQGGVDTLMKQIGPSLAFTVPNEITGEDGAEVSVDLKFGSIDDFSPVGVATQIPETAKLLEARQRLADLYGKVESNARLDGILGDILSDDEKQARLRAELGMDDDPQGE